MRQAALVAGIALLVASVVMPFARAQTPYVTLYNFQAQPDAQTPWAGLVRDAHGNLYGTTVGGGSNGLGTIFKLSSTGEETVLHSFSGSKGDGAYPYAPLVLDDATGFLYGTTGAGGNAGCLDGAGCGTVFKVDKHGKETVLYIFHGKRDGADPDSPVTLGANGILYGTTSVGGTHNLGTVFKLDATGNESVLHSFTGGADGSMPEGGLIRDKSGSLYGTTSGNISPYYACIESLGNGTVFKIDSRGKFTVLHAFQGGAEGRVPCAGVIQDRSGNLYGTLFFGGYVDGYLCSEGCGTVFKLDRSGGMSVLYTFTGPDGANPYAGLVQDAAGTLYGTTILGGDLSYCGGGETGCGTFFSLDRSGVETVLHAFRAPPDGYLPYGGLTRDKGGNLYGTTTFGGLNSVGMVFEFSP